MVLEYLLTFALKITPRKVNILNVPYMEQHGAYGIWDDYQMKNCIEVNVGSVQHLFEETSKVSEFDPAISRLHAIAGCLRQSSSYQLQRNCMELP